MTAIQDIVFLYQSRLLGFSEARGLLELKVPGFSTVRDHELDEYVTLGEQAQDEEKSLDDEPPKLPDE